MAKNPKQRSFSDLPENDRKRLRLSLSYSRELAKKEEAENSGTFCEEEATSLTNWAAAVLFDARLVTMALSGKILIDWDAAKGAVVRAPTNEEKRELRARLRKIK